MGNYQKINPLKPENIENRKAYLIGGREIEEHFECFMELFSFIPSLTDKNRSVLDEFRELNLEEPIESHCRLVHNQGEKLTFQA